MNSQQLAGLPSQVQLLHYRRSVSDMYAAVRSSTLSPQERWQQWRQTRDHLLDCHPQTPLEPEQRSAFHGTDYFDYNPALRITACVDGDVEGEILPIETEEDGIVQALRAGRVRFEVVGEQVSLSIFWLLGYGGGLFLPFRDTIKHADLGQTGLAGTFGTRSSTLIWDRPLTAR